MKRDCYVVVGSHVLVKRDCYVVGSHLVKRDFNVVYMITLSEDCP